MAYSNQGGDGLIALFLLDQHIVGVTGRNRKNGYRCFSQGRYERRQNAGHGNWERTLKLEADPAFFEFSTYGGCVLIANERDFVFSSR